MECGSIIGINYQSNLFSLDLREGLDINQICAIILENIENSFFVALHALDSFVQLNWTGPGIDESKLSMPLKTALCSKSALRDLTVDTVPAYTLCVFPGFLSLSYQLLYSDNIYGHENAYQLAHAKVCLIKVWQSVLDNSTMTLRELFVKELPKLNLGVEALSDSEKVLLCSQLCETCFMFYLQNEALSYLAKANEASKISIEFAGALGVNTKFQTDALSQLFVKIDILDTFVSNFAEKTCEQHPRNKALDDDTLLPETKFLNPEATEIPDICLEQQIVVCLKLYHHLHHLATDTSTEYERKALVNAIVKFKSKFYPVQYYGLFQRSAIEGKHIRYLDRLLMQMEDLQSCYSLSSKDLSKMVAFFALSWPSKWQTDRQYADILFELGCTATSLEIYLKLEMWEIAASCYVRLDRRTEGTELIEKQLAKNPTANLWCLLGDLKSEPECYRKALEITGGKFSKAFKALGVYYCGEKKMELAVEDFEKSLNLNSLQPGVWYSMGCCAMSIEDWERGLKAFQRFVKLEPENAEGWSNLGAVFVNMHDITRAHRAFSQAARHSFDNWQIWENFLLTSVSTGEVQDAIRCFKRILQLKDRRLDILAFQKTTQMFIKSKKDHDELSWSRQKAFFMEFMGFVTSKVSTMYQVWECYGDVCYECGEDFADKEKGTRFYIKALRQLMNTPKVDSNFELFMSCSKKSEKLLKCFDEFVNESAEKCPEDLKVELNGSLRNLKNFYNLEASFFEHVTPETEKLIADLIKFLDQLEQRLKSV